MDAGAAFPMLGIDSTCNVEIGTLLTASPGEKHAQSNPEIKIANGWGGKRPGAGRKPNPIKPTPRLLQRAVGPRWYVLQILSHQQDAIVQELRKGESRPGYIPRPSFETYVPRTLVEVINRDGQRETVQRNMFVGYLFAKFDHRVDPWPLVKEASGVLRIFTTNSINEETQNFTPLPLPVGFVEYLQETAADRLNLPKTRLAPFDKGQALQIEGGSLDGQRAVCVECDGLTTLVRLKLFNRDVEIIMQRAELAPAGAV